MGYSIAPCVLQLPVRGEFLARTLRCDPLGLCAVSDPSLPNRRRQGADLLKSALGGGPVDGTGASGRDGAGVTSNLFGQADSDAPLPPAFRAVYGGSTDAGGNKENQDDLFIYQTPDQRDLVIGVFDGHGREVGKLAANTCSASMQRDLCNPEAIDRVRADCPTPPAAP